MDGFSSHTFMWYNEAGEYVWVKVHFKTVLGNKTFTNDEAVKMAGKPNHATEDLYNAIESKNYPEWKVYVR